MKWYIFSGIICLILLFSPAFFHGPGFIGPGLFGPKYTSIIIVCCLIMVVAAVMAHSHTKFKGPSGPRFTGPQGTTGQAYRFTGQSQIVTADQAKTYSHGTPVIVAGNLVLATGHDLYLFRDSSPGGGEINVRIGPMEWQNYGSNISPSDPIEISGEVHFDQINRQGIPEIHARFIRKL